MTGPLVVLAVGSVGAGFLGMPAALGGSNVFEHWLAPVMAHGAHAGHGHHDLSLEYGLMAASVGVALAGIGLAWLMYQRRAIRPEAFSEAAGGWAYKAVYNKYWVDEAYYAVFLGGTLALARTLAWIDRYVIDGVVNGSALVTRVAARVHGAFDFKVVDGLVNATAGVIHGFGGWARRLQTGSINGYLYVVVVLVTAVLFAKAW